MFGLAELVIILVFLLGGAFWIWMLVDCATKEPDSGNSKLVWILIIIFTGCIGGRHLLLCSASSTENGTGQMSSSRSSDNEHTRVRNRTCRRR